MNRTYIPGHASHIVVLAALGHHVPIQNIVEYGSGFYSTVMCFLNRSLYPYVERVTAYEHDPLWCKRVEYMAGYDRRLQIIDCYPAAETVRQADLVLIDNGPGHEGRRQAIQHCLSCDPQGLVVLHDAQEGGYFMPLHQNMKNHIYVGYLHPQTAVFWNGDYDRAQLEKRLDDLELIFTPEATNHPTPQ